MDLAIAIVSYNTRELTSACLSSVYHAMKAEGLDGQVWVVDNASADGSADMVMQRYPQAVCIASPDNLGFARGTNVAIEHVRRLPTPPRHLLLLNPDTRVLPGALSSLIQHLDAHPTVGVVGAQLLYDDGSFQHGAFRFPSLWMALFDFWTINHRLANSRLNGRYSPRQYATGEPFPIDHPLGAGLMIRWDAVERVGLLDEGFFMYCEEIDWCWRVKRAGYSIYCVPAARIVHLAGQSTRQFRDTMFIALWRSRFRLFSKHYGVVYRFVVRRIVRLGLRREMARTRAALRQGKLDDEAAETKLAALRVVMGM